MTFSKETLNFKGGFVALLAALLLLCAVTAGAQTAVNPATTTVQYGGSPNTDNVVSNFTAPAGGLVLHGTRISAFTGQPVRYLWVGDGNFGLCRVDPEIDAPGIHDINVNTCPFKLNGASITGGPLAFDPQTNFLYLDDIRNSQGVFRMHYLPDGDTGNGSLDFNSVFAMAGNPTNARFRGGQTGCQWPTNSTLAANPAAGASGSMTLGPDNNVYVGFKKSGEIVRINNPSTATSTGFGTCADFVQVIATTPDNRSSNGLTWIGHDLWSADGTSPFFISNADTTCQALGNTPPQTPTCVATSTLAAVGATNSLTSDQFFPMLNGNNLYFGLGAPGNIIWVGNVGTGNPATETIDATFINTAQLPPPPTFPALGNISNVSVDYTDPGNLIVFGGEDPSGVGALGAGRWWMSCQGNPPAVPGSFNCPTPGAGAVPNPPTVVRATPGDGFAAVSWSASQDNQPVASYTIHINPSDASVLSDVVVNPAPGALFPPTTATLTLANNLSYTFQLSASNGQGASALSTASNSVNLPGYAVPGIPTMVSATAGDQAAAISWTAPGTSGGAPITGYTITALINHVRTATIANVGAAANSVIMAGLTNGSTYSFVVHASNAGGSGMDSTPSNDVVPALQPNSVSVSIAGPPIPPQPPAQVTFNVTITNSTPFPITNATLTSVLSQTTPDGAFLLIAQPTQGTCTAGGTGQTTIACNLGSLDPLATVKVNVIAKIQGNAATLTSTFSGTDSGNNSVTATSSFTLVPPPPTSTTDLAITGSASNGGPTVTGTLPTGAPDTFTWQVKDNQNVTANAVVFTNTLPTGNSLRFDSVTLNPASLGTCTGPVGGATSGAITCNISQFGGGVTVSQFTVTVGMHVLVTGTINNTAKISFSGTDTNTANNQATVTIKAK